MLKKLIFGLLIVLSWVSCKEEIDDSAFAIATGKTIAEYVDQTEDLSDFKILLQRVKLGYGEQASSVFSVLSARGNYVCFFPKNKELGDFCEAKNGSRDVTLLDDETAELLVYNCIIDCGTETAFESPDFPENGAFNKACLSQRLLNCKLQKDGETYTLNSTSNVTTADIETTNGRVNIVDVPIAPSMKTVPDIVLEADNMKIMGMLLKMTAWADSMATYQDAEFNMAEHEETRLFSGVGTFKIEQNRYLGFTAFIEPDAIFQQEWGVPAPTLDKDGNVTNMDAIIAAMKPHCEAVYGTEAADDLKNTDNAINQFVAYHLMKGKYPYNRLLHHFNEYGYQYGTSVTSPQENQYTIDVWDYYPAMSPHPSVLKLVQVPDGNHEIYINRVSKYSRENYVTESVVNEGVQVLGTNGENDNNALNGFYHTLNGILLYDQHSRQMMGNERIRFDICDMLHELQSNTDRGQGYKGFERGYFENILKETESTLVYYLVAGKGSNWRDYQGDEFLFSGTYDFVLRLPPVPVTGIYEIRMGVAMNPYRSMAQIYFGDNPDNLQPAGLPYDLRQSANNNPAMPWVADTGSEAVDIENDNALRIQGFMKGPRYFTMTDGNGNQQARSFGGDYPCMRRILLTTQMSADKTYYLRFKTALENTDSQFFLDYFEFCPSIVYNGTESEDQW